VLRIQRSNVGGFLVLAISGRIEEKQVPQLQSLLNAEADAQLVTLDLGELRLVHREAVRFLRGCEEAGVKLTNCPSYIREWIETGSGKSDES
jgi:hypothetical protein